LRDFESAGVPPSRLTVIPRGQYYNWFDAADIALDTMPYGGGATTFDALWMGVPVVTLAGTRTASRSAASILAALALREWIAASEEDYVGVAVAAAADPGRIASLRASLRGRMAASPLMDEAGFAREVGAALRVAWREWCAVQGG
jgi:protein O-GlcNAc transferase